MLSKLPRWIWVGAWVLAVVAGMINVIALLGFAKVPVSHFTGTTSNLGIAIADADLPVVEKLTAVIVAFVLGTILSGFVIKDSTLRLGRHYSIALTIETAVLCIAVPLLDRQYSSGVWCLALACGLQNAMASTYSGSIIRTTHISGMYTDLGIFIGQRLAGVPADVRRFKLCVIIIAGFLLGGMIGASLFLRFQNNAVFVPAGLTGAAAITYTLYRVRREKHVDPAGRVPLDDPNP